MVNFTLPTLDNPTDIEKMDKAEQICCGLIILLKSAQSKGEFVGTHAEHDVFYAGTDSALSEVDRTFMEALGWSRSQEGPDGAYEIFT